MVPDAVPEGFHWTVEEGKKPVPVTVRVNAGPPAITELGLSAVIAGGLRTVKVNALDVPPPGGPLKTVMVAVSGVETLDDPSSASSPPLGPGNVGSGLPFHRTLELLLAPVMKFVPVTAIVTGGSPKIGTKATMVLGFKEEIVGTGFDVGGGGGGGLL